MAENIKISASTAKYWSTVLDLIDVAGDYAAAIKLHANLSDITTEWKVRHVLNEYYSGKISNLEDAIRCHRSLFHAKVEKLNILCRQNNVMPIRYEDRLLNMLLDGKKRTSYREKAQRRLKKNIICPLQDFEPKKTETKGSKTAQ
ncbi:hypothetical protein IJU85_00190 [Candidatus Saccharibacteria bacterium]|nr:hypothetical protein [Candidatus Saccharibacteria bacterium]MBQ9484519.1 hypothetical protein [Candidatus Saccharibacteria bacterium]